MNKIACFLLLIASIINASEEMRVELKTEADLLSLYSTEITSRQSDFNKQYLEQLNRVLRFDLAHNGMTRLLEQSINLDQAAEKLDEKKEAAIWSKHGIEYVVRPYVKGNLLHADIYSTRGRWLKAVDHIELNGDLDDDRRQIHLLADIVHKMLFGKEGIARSRILYTVRKQIPGKKEWSADIWESDYDGANSRQILFNVGYTVTPQYAPPEKGKQSRHFFFVSYQTGQPKIYMADLSGKHVQRLTKLRGNQLMPTLSKQRDTLAFISDAGGNPDLFIQEFSPAEGAVGKPRQIFSARMATQGTPTFSPDGQELAFVSNKDGSARIYAMKIPPEGAKLTELRPRLITKFRRGCTAPAWSPDGRRIAYCARVDGIRQIFVYDFFDKSEKQLTSGPKNKENPAWASNSLHLIYNASTATQSDLYMLNLKQLKPIKLTSGPGEKRFPSWEPL